MNFYLFATILVWMAYGTYSFFRVFYPKTIGDFLTVLFFGAVFGTALDIMWLLHKFLSIQVRK